MIRALLTALVLACPSVAAADSGLYPEAAPEDAAFVRFVGLDVPSVDFDGHRFTLDPEASDAYIPVSAARLDAVAPGSFLTVTSGPDGPRAIAEGPRPDRSKIYLFVINASDTPVSLQVAEGEVPVITDIAGGQAGSRAVNPVQITFAVVSDADAAPLGTFDVTLKRGQNLSFFVGPDGARVIPHRFGPVSR
ncbi:MAG: alginate O-acetyltransferase AlgF [Pseudomonadota bacterium]